MRVKIVVVMLVLLLSATVSTANPGGKGDDVRSRDCAGSCHASSSSNGVSTASLSITFPNEVYAGLLIEVQTSVGEIDVSSNNMMGMALLINSDSAKDLPANDGWEIVTDPNGGMNNYVEILLRPLARLLAISLRPPFLAILDLNPCLLFLTKLLG